MDAKIRSYYHTNKLLWDKLAAIHPETDFYGLKEFEAGESSLNATELRELGSIKGLDILHLQCHFGMDTISFKRDGAAYVLGIDFSDLAVKTAQELAFQCNVDVQFQQSNVLQFNTSYLFDMIFTSYGVLCWLHDLEGWAKMIYRSLKKGGVFYMVEFHPALMMLEFESGNLRPQYTYFNSGSPDKDWMSNSYADVNRSVQLENYTWNHPISDVYNVLTKVGLEVLFIHEFPFCHYGCFPNMEQNVKGQWYMEGFENLLPLMYSIKAKKK